MTPAPTPPEPVGDWAAYSAAQARALHGEHTPDLDPIREWLNADPYDDPVESQYKQAIGHIRTLFTAIDDRDTTINRLRAERDALRSRLAELEAWIKVAKDWIPDDAARDDLDRLTRDGGGR